MAPAVIAAIMSIVQMGIGAAQSSGEKPEREPYYIPEEVFEAQDLMRKRISSELPGRRQMIAGMEQRAQTGISALRELTNPASALGGVTAITEGLQEGTRKINVAQAGYTSQAELDYSKVLQTVAEYQDKEWEYNVNFPHMEDMNVYYNRMQAGSQNIWGGFQGFGSSMMSQMSSDRMDAMLDKIFGSGEIDTIEQIEPMEEEIYDWGSGFGEENIGYG